MKLKKQTTTIFAVLLVLVMCFMTGCGGAQETTPAETTESAETTAPAEPTAESISVQTVSALRSADEVHSDYPDAHVIVLGDDEVTLDGETLEEFDYTWHADPSEDHGEVKNCPAEYFTGTEPETDAAAYIAHDIYYYPQLSEDGFRQVSYDGETEWCYYYTAEGYEDYIFATLPLGTNIMSRSEATFPADMMHTEEEAYENPVVHITQPGQYILEGQWQGQIWVDLGDSDDTFADENAKVTLILNDVDITCTVAPAVVFYSVYECDNTWEDRDTYTADVDLSDAGAQVILVDGSVNNISGTNVFRMLKTKFKDEEQSYEGQPQKKARKTDGAFYSYVSMTVNGETNGDGTLNITAGFEGLDTELHLAINGGMVNIFSQDDGINVNEDGVSVVTFNGGSVHILGGLGTEGDGVDSNGFLVINGGTVISSASPMSDSGLDSDGGSFIYGGTVLALGSTMDWAESDGSDQTQAVMNLRFSTYETADEEIEIRDADGNTVFYYEPEDDSVISGHARNYMGAVISCAELTVGQTYTVYVGGVQQGYASTGELSFGGPGGGFGGFGQGGFDGTNKPDNFDPSNLPEGFDPNNMPEGFDPNNMPEGFNSGNMPDGNMPNMPTDFDPNNKPDGTQAPADGTQAPADGTQPPADGTQAPAGGTQGGMQTPPDGFDQSQGSGSMPQRPDGTQAPADGTQAPTDRTQGGFGGFGGNTSSTDLQTEFLLEDTVNGFSGVADYTE